MQLIVIDAVSKKGIWDDKPCTHPDANHRSEDVHHPDGRRDESREREHGSVHEQEAEEHYVFVKFFAQSDHHGDRKD